MTIYELRTAILNGDFDDYLPLITEAVHHRQKGLASLRLSEVRIGDRVVFSQTARPQYLRGLEAVVKGRSGDKLIVNIVDSWAARRYAGHDVKCPASIVEVVK